MRPEPSGIVAKWGLRIGDVVLYEKDDRKYRIRGFRADTVELEDMDDLFAFKDSCFLVRPNKITLIERDPLSLDWMNQEQWNLGRLAA